MAYEFHYLSSRLILVRWKRYPTPNEEQLFLTEHTRQLDNAEEPLFYISDLRKGRIITAHTINKMSALAQHPNYGGGTAFSKDSISRMVVNNFRRFTHEASEKAAIFDTPEESLTFLESLQPGITEGIDWNTYLMIRSS